MNKSFQVASLFFLTHLGLIFFFYPSLLLDHMESGHWLAIVSGFLIHFAAVWAYTKGLSRFDRLHVMDIFKRAGRPAAVALLLPVAALMLASCMIVVRVYAEVIVLIFLSSTPLWATMALLLAIAGYMALLGIEALFRTGLLVGCLCLPLVLFVLISTFQHADWRYLLPIADRESWSFSFLLAPFFLRSLFAYGGCFVFLGFIQPEVTFDKRKVWAASGLLLPFFLLSVYVPLLTFGRNTARLFTFPFVMTIDTIEINWLMFDRVSMFFMLGLIAFIMLLLALLLWNLARIVRFAAPVPEWLIVPAAALAIFIVCMRIPNREMMEGLFGWTTLLRMYTMIVIPAVALAMGLFNGRKEGPHHG